MVVAKKENDPGSSADYEYAELLPFIFAKWKRNKSFHTIAAGGLLILGTEVLCLIINVVGL
jgi:hypothetical protein